MLKKMKPFLLLCCVVVTALAFIPTLSYGADLTVTLPSFPVTLNGIKIDNAKSQYPLIVYKDITYFPLTYYDCRFLGIETDWTQASGLKIMKTGTLWDYKPYPISKKNQSSYQATIAKLPITVNNQRIDNSKEPYPLLTFRNVTYFPLTWRFAVNFFGWTYDYNQGSGLSIQAGDSVGAKAQEVILPLATFSLKDDRGFPARGDFTKLGAYYYYQGENGGIYQASASNLNNRKKVMQLEKDDNFYFAGSNSYPVCRFYTENNKVFMLYHLGGATMGNDLLFHIKEDGTHEKVVDRQYFSYHEFPNMTVFTDQSVPPTANNLYIKTKDSSKFMRIEEPSYTFALSKVSHFVVGDSIYALAHENNKGAEKGYYLYKINWKTGEMTKLSDIAARDYDMNGTTIYFIGSDRDGLYKVPLTGGKTERVSDQNIEQIAVLDNAVFYTDSSGLLYLLGNDTCLNPDSITSNITAKDGYLYASFSSGPYKFMVFDQRGKAVAKTIENVAGVFMENGKVVYVKGQ